MNPDATLEKILKHVNVVQNSTSSATRATHGEWLADAVAELHEWLLRGGSLPGHWTRARDREVVAAIQRELDAHPTWRPGQPVPAGDPVTYLQVRGERVAVPLATLDRTNPTGVTVWESGLGGESPTYYPPGQVPSSWRDASTVEPVGWLDGVLAQRTPEEVAAQRACRASVDPDGHVTVPVEPSTYEDPAVQRAIAETIARGDA